MGVVSPIPETYGADILWVSKLGLVGVQRKKFPGDFLASVHDARFYELLMKMKTLDLAVLIVEGKGRWTTDGNLITDYGQKQWTRTSHYNFLTSVQMRGVTCLSTDSLAGTIKCIRGLRMWTDKPEHNSLDIRPTPRGDWGKVTNRDWQLHVLKSFPKISVKRAAAMLDHFGFFPLGWRVTEEQLREVPGIGKGLARALMEVFEK